MQDSSRKGLLFIFELIGWNTDSFDWTVRRCSKSVGSTLNRATSTIHTILLTI